MWKKNRRIKSIVCAIDEDTNYETFSLNFFS